MQTRQCRREEQGCEGGVGLENEGTKGEGRWRCRWTQRQQKSMRVLGRRKAVAVGNSRVQRRENRVLEQKQWKRGPGVARSLKEMVRMEEREGEGKTEMHMEELGRGEAVCTGG